MIIADKECPKCRNTYILTTEYWHRNRSKNNGFNNYCKTCKNDAQNKKRKEKINAQSKERKKKNELKQIQNIDKRMELINIKELKYEGLKLDNLKLNLGQAYRINIPVRGKTNNNFIGKLETITDRLVIFRHKNGYCEGFLKVDLLLEHKYKELS